MADEFSKLGRRTLLQLIPASLAGTALRAEAVNHCGVPEKAENNGSYEFRFFTPAEVELFNLIAGEIIPADEHSPGAIEAKVVEFADLLVSTGSESTKEDWRIGSGLLAAELKRSSVHAWLDEVAQHEDDPQTVLEIFFRTLKQMTVNGYYTSKIGIHDDLRYQGNTYVKEFVGCDHQEHQS